MASFWSALRSEVLGTVDDIRQKGVANTFKDVALDVADLAREAASAVSGQVQGLVSTHGEDDLSSLAVVRSEGVPLRGATVPLELANGDVVSATVLDVDGISEPPRARVVVEGEEPRLVLVLAPGAAAASQAEGRLMLESLRQEWDSTLQEFREKGAVAAVKDATLDTVDLLGDAAKAIGQRTASLSRPLVERTTFEAGAAEASGGEAARPRTSLLEAIKQEVASTVEDLRPAVDTLSSATRDAVGYVSSAAKSVGSGAVTLAKPLVDLDAPLQRGAEGAAAGAAWLKEEWTSTVQDVREKGAVETMKERAADVAKGARSVAGPLLERASAVPDQLWGPASSSSAPAGATSAAAPEPGAPAAAALPLPAAAAASPAEAAETVPPAAPRGAAASRRRPPPTAEAAESAAAAKFEPAPRAATEAVAAGRPPQDPEELLD